MTEVRRRPRTGYLATPLSADERHRIGKMYRQHQGLLRLLGRKLCRKYPFVSSDDIYSCIDTGFIKTCRAWDPAKGTFSTILTVFAEGDVLHFIRDSNWMIKAPGNMRRIGQLARKLFDQGYGRDHVLTQLQVTDEQLKMALIATQPTDHDIKGFAMHVCPRPTPWELLEGYDPA